jgi:hypothetical protein
MKICVPFESLSGISKNIYHLYHLAISLTGISAKVIRRKKKISLYKKSNIDKLQINNKINCKNNLIRRLQGQWCIGAVTNPVIYLFAQFILIAFLRGWFS